MLDTACGQLGPLSPLLGFTVLCVQSSSRGSLFTVSLNHLDSSPYSLLHSTVFLFMALTILSYACSVPLPLALIRLLQLYLSFPVWRQHECSGSVMCPHLIGASMLLQFVPSVMSWIRSFSTMAVNRFQIPLNRGLIPCRFCFFLSGAISAARSGLLQIQHHTHVKRS